MPRSGMKAKKTVKRSPKERAAEHGPPLRPRVDDAELKRRAIERWENEGGRPRSR